MDASALARTLGRRGGLARARRLSSVERKRVASLGGRARRESLQAARRIADNFRYLAAIQELTPTARVTRLKAFRGRLPGLYPAT